MTTSGWQGEGTVFQALRPGAGSKTGDFVKEKLGGAIVERILSALFALFA